MLKNEIPARRLHLSSWGRPGRGLGRSSGGLKKPRELHTRLNRAQCQRGGGFVITGQSGGEKRFAQ